MKLNDKVYQILKYVCITFLPIVAMLTSIILQTWHICDDATINNIVTTINAVASAIGGLIGVSAVNYYIEQKKEGSK